MFCSLMTIPSASQSTAQAVPRDTLGRPLQSLRISVIDRCDLRCAYCMPEEDYTWLPKDDILTFDEIERTVDAFGALGVRKVRLTGGEPLLRGGITELVHRLAGHADVQLVGPIPVQVQRLECFSPFVTSWTVPNRFRLGQASLVGVCTRGINVP